MVSPYARSTGLFAKGALMLLLFITFNLPIGIVFGVLHNQVHSGINFFTYNTLEWGQIQTNFWWVFTLRKKNHHFCSLFDLARESSNSNWTEKWKICAISLCFHIWGVNFKANMSSFIFPYWPDSQGLHYHYMLYIGEHEVQSENDVNLTLLLIFFVHYFCLVSNYHTMECMS